MRTWPSGLKEACATAESLRTCGEAAGTPKGAAGRVAGVTIRTFACAGDAGIARNSPTTVRMLVHFGHCICLKLPSRVPQRHAK